MSSGADSTPRPLPRLTKVWDGQVEPLDAAKIGQQVDIAFLAVPESAAAELGQSLLGHGVRVIDLSGAFRIRDDAARARWYPATKSLPSGSAYGLVEHYRADVKGASLIACPGCYPTAALLSLLPLNQAGLID
jgi:N-acetyl-gamma-glutamyl-phosphate reductase